MQNTTEIPPRGLRLLGRTTLRRSTFLALTTLTTASLTATSCFERFDGCGSQQACSDDPTTGGTSNTGGSTPGGAGTGAGDAPPTCKPACDDPTPLCDETTSQCVECLDHSDCTDDATARCDAGVCKPCTESSQCTNSDSPACDAKTGECVECTPDDESPCGNKSCNPATKQCTDTTRKSRAACRPCLADSECHENHRCVPMEFNGEPREGGYCLKLLSAECERPLMVPSSPRGSLSGAAPAVYCGVAEERTTCEALADLLEDRTCSTKADCGVPGLDDARCETVNGGPYRCTYSCDAANQCPNTFACGQSPDDYCGYVEH